MNTGTVIRATWRLATTLLLVAIPAVLVLLLTVIGAAVSGAAMFDFERPVFWEAGYSVKDHSLIEVEGVFHLYYIRGDETTFGYASSPDLIHWTIHDPVLEAGPESWDSTRIWAPMIVPYPNNPGYLLMYYTGVNEHYAQRTCLALTTVPSIWHKAPAILFEPFHGDPSWIYWNELEWSNYRDPCFYSEDGVCYLLHTSQTADRFYSVIALAASDDHFTWHDAGPLYIHNNWTLLESSFLIKRNGKYHLFFTEEGVGGVSHMASDALLSGWDIATRSIIDGGHAAELLYAGSDGYIFSRHSGYTSPSGIKVTTIRFDTLSFYGDTPQVNPVKSFGSDWTVLWGTAFDHQPVFGDNPRFRGEDTTDVAFEGNWWIGTYESFNGPLTGTYPGSSQGDEPRGAIRSRIFTVVGTEMRLLVGGGNYPDSCHVALCDALSGRILHRETGRNTDHMDERLWNLLPYRHRDVYITIVDNCSGPFGHINVDGIEERLSSVPPSPDDGDVDLTIDKGLREKMRHSLSSQNGIEAPSPPPSIANYPNPFNPVTEIRFSTAPNSSCTIIIYATSGEEVMRFTAATDGEGTGRVWWDGRNRGGRLVAAGIYPAVLHDDERVLAHCKLVLLK